MPKSQNDGSDLARMVSRHSLSYILCAISEMFRAYDFDPLDLLIVHSVLNANVIDIMKHADLDRRLASIHAVEPDELKRGVSRAALSRFLNLPLETIRRRVNGLKRKGVIAEVGDGLIVSGGNAFKFGNNHHLQAVNLHLIRKLLRDLKRAGLKV
ncbi:MAG TPA: hypothetical protein VHC94_02025 [Nitrobacter sp.]|jgi:hypothetical protein|nr:hypothetical protein [Nitrobacter sp.]